MPPFCPVVNDANITITVIDGPEKVRAYGSRQHGRSTTNDPNQGQSKRTAPPPKATSRPFGKAAKSHPVKASTCTGSCSVTIPIDQRFDNVVFRFSGSAGLVTFELTTNVGGRDVASKHVVVEFVDYLLVVAPEQVSATVSVPLPPTHIPPAAMHAYNRHVGIFA